MDLTQLANLGEFIGGVAVLVTLIYLAVQLRQNTSQLKQQTASTVVTNLQAAFDPVFPNFRIYAQGLNGEQELSEDEALMFSTMMLRILHGMQNSYYQNREGTLAEEWDLFHENVLRYYLARPGGERWWGEHRTFFHDRFRAQVDALLERTRRGPPQGGHE